MLIIKPYGRSETEAEFDSGKNIRRKIRENPGHKETIDVANFAEDEHKLVIAQWISVIDKIATKPNGRCKPTAEQRELRDKIGKAALNLLSEKFGISGDEIKRLWGSKIHPYPKGTYRPNRICALKGRWYARFAGNQEPATVDAEAVVQKIDEHLYRAEYRIKDKRPNKRQGLIAARSGSIANNVPKLLGKPANKPDWSEHDEQEYVKAGNVAALIRERAKGPGRFSVRDAAPILYEQYGRLFQSDDKDVLAVAEAQEKFPGLYALHSAIKDTYCRILKNHRKQGNVTRVLPQDVETLFRLVKSKLDNREINSLTRLGKVIHYTAGHAETDTIVTNWPTEAMLSTSQYLTSKGQAAIKRNEAFVRVWHFTIGLAAHTLKDWADHEEIKQDILGSSETEKVTGDKFDKNAYHRKLPLLFGNQSEQFRSRDADFEKSVLRLALKGWAGLRNSSFHFRGRGHFVQALKSNLLNMESNAIAEARESMRHDLKKRREQLIKTMGSANVEYYFEQKTLNVLVATIVKDHSPQSPLPKLNRVLLRAKNAWSHRPNILRLPLPGKRAELEKSSVRRCQYIVAKALYERAFPAWLENQPAEDLNVWIKRAVKRATQAAQSINKDEYAVAKAAGLIQLNEQEGITHFLDRLSASTATELRVQRGYSHDANKAQEQAKYLDDLRCDVVAQAFATYLNDKDLLRALNDLDAKPQLPRNKISSLKNTSLPVSASLEKGVENWQAVLYFLIHLVPVDAIAQLQHQLRKWSILEESHSDDANSLEQLFSLYLDMHDAKFEGEEGRVGAEALKDLFESADIFSQVFPSEPSDEDIGQLPLRGLREIQRFGDLTPLQPIFQRHRITSSQVEKLHHWEKTMPSGNSRIADQQKERECLHEKWEKSRRKRHLSDADKKAYKKALKDVERHRHLAAHVRLNNHVRLHRLLMKVLGRLVGYAALWERDLYFTTLALISLRGESLQKLLDSETITSLLKGGGIVAVLKKLRKLNDGESGKEIFRQLKGLFGEYFLHSGQGASKVRNDLAHFNVLAQQPLDLTKAVNETRRLMAYDRKLKNAVSKSIIEMLAQEGLALTWEMNNHQLTHAKIKTRQIPHLGGKIKEYQHGIEYVKMVAALFNGETFLLGDE